MTNAQPSGVVVDTMVVSWLFDERPNRLAEHYRALIGPRRVLLAVLRVGWGQLRRRRLERRIAELTVVQPDDEMITMCATLRAHCTQIGHALAGKLHDGDRWIAASAMRLNVPLVSHDAIFDGAPSLQLVTAIGDE